MSTPNPRWEKPVPSSLIKTGYEAGIWDVFIHGTIWQQDRPALNPLSSLLVP